MKKIRDFIYNFNDIFVALIIIIIAAGVIFWRVNTIMNYNDYIASGSRQEEEVTIDDVDLTAEDVDDFNTNPEDANSDAIEVSETTASEPEPEPEVEEAEPTKPQGDVKFEVPSGASADRIGGLLVEAGLIESKQDYLDELTAQNAETKLKAGTFTIPAGSTVTDIIKILTK